MVLSCKKNERIIIAGNVTIEVLEIRHDRVRIGINAPKNVPIHRDELLVQLNGYKDVPAVPGPPVRERRD